MLNRTITVLFLFMTLNLFAMDGNIKVFIKSHDAIYTSQKVTVSVELLSDAFSITDAKITFPASQKYIVQAPKSAAYLGKEEINGTDWQMVHYDYEVYTLQSGKIEIPPVSVSFTASMGYGQPKKKFTLSSDTLTVAVKTPEGVKSDQFILVTDNFRLDAHIKPDKKQLITGDALELSLTQKAKGIPDILLTPIIYKSNVFLRVYEKEPELKSGLKGRYDVSRTDKFTLVAGSEGNVTLPSQEILWWNSVTKKIHSEKTPAYSFEIIPDPQIAIDAKKAQQEQRLFYVLLVVLMLVGLYLLFASKIRHYREERKRLYLQSEEGKFDILLTCMDKGNNADIYHVFYAWLELADANLARVGFKGISTLQPSFETVLMELNAALAEPEKRFDKKVFVLEVQKLRKKLLEEKNIGAEGLAQRLNPQ